MPFPYVFYRQPGNRLSTGSQAHNMLPSRGRVGGACAPVVAAARGRGALASEVGGREASGPPNYESGTSIRPEVSSRSLKLGCGLLDSRCRQEMTTYRSRRKRGSERRKVATRGASAGPGGGHCARRVGGTERPPLALSPHSSRVYT